MLLFVDTKSHYKRHLAPIKSIVKQYLIWSFTSKVFEKKYMNLFQTDIFAAILVREPKRANNYAKYNIL